jgi:hypothetical protein
MAFSMILGVVSIQLISLTSREEGEFVYAWDNKDLVLFPFN